MTKQQRTFPGMDSNPRRVSKAETFAAVQSAFIAILKQRQATADALRDYLDIPAAGLPAIGRAIADLARQGLIEQVEFTLSIRAKAHSRPLRIWRLSDEKSPTNGQG